MDILAVIALSLVPGVLWLFFFYRKDKLEPEPKSIIAKIFLLGMLLIFPATLLEYPFREIRQIQIVVIAPVIEEILKYLIIRFTIYKKMEFDEPMDGIIYASSVALGFASAENAVYILSTYLAPQIALGQSDPAFAFGFVWKLYIVRAFLTVPGHAIWSSMWGYSMGWTKFFKVEKRRMFILKSLLLAIILHSIFNYLITNYIPGAIGILVLVPVMWRMLYNRIETALNNSPHLETSNIDEK